MLSLQLATLLAFQSMPLAGVIPNSTEAYRSKESKYKIYNFEGTYPNLKEVQIEVKGRETLNLEGTFPVLNLVEIKGDSANFEGRLTGNFSALKNAAFLFSNSTANLDFRGTWQQNCLIRIKSTSGDVHLQLPSNVGATVKVKISSGEVITANSISKSFWGKIYYNPAYGNSNVNLTIEIEEISGNVYLQ